MMHKSIGHLQCLERLQRLQSLERLQRLQSSKWQNLETLERDYRDVELPRDAVVYCDTPYAGKEEYAGAEAFDSDAFHDWVRAQNVPVFVSEYAMPDDFVSVWQTEKRVMLSASENRKRATERLWLQERWAHEYAVPLGELYE